MDRARSFIRGSNLNENGLSKNITPKPSWSGADPSATEKENELAVSSFRTFTSKRSYSLPGSPTTREPEDPRFDFGGEVLNAESEESSTISWNFLSSKRIQRFRSDKTLKKERSSKSLSRQRSR